MVYWSNSKQLEIEDNITIKTASKRAIQKTAEAISDLTGNTITNKTTRVSKISPKKNSETKKKKKYFENKGRKCLITWD